MKHVTLALCVALFGSLRSSAQAPQAVRWEYGELSTMGSEPTIWTAGDTTLVIDGGFDRALRHIDNAASALGAGQKNVAPKAAQAEVKGQYGTVSHRTEPGGLISFLNVLGDQGWELVSVLREETSGRASSLTAFASYTFKRQRPRA